MLKKPEDSAFIQNYIQKQLGNIRKKQSLTQEQVANMAEISPKALSDIETNRKGVSLKTLIKLCCALNIDIIKLFS